MDNIEQVEEPIVEDSVVEESVEATEPEVQINPLSMSDEEFAKFEEESETQETAPEEVLDEVEDISTEEEESVDNAPQESPELALNKETAYDAIMAEFKANGKMQTVSSVEEVRQLMAMGANYNKKMNGLKEDRRYIQMLKNNELLDESKLNYLIDLSKKDPKAIKQLLKESEIDPMDLDMESDTDSEYKPNTYTVDDSQVQLDDVLVALQDTETYSTTIDIIGTKWDVTSREELANNPSDITKLNSDVASGVYDEVVEVLERERMLGNLEGVTDFKAYKMVGNAMHAKGLFKAQQANTQQAPVQQVNEAPKIADVKKKAAATPRMSKPAKPIKVTKNPLSMSDEEFNKLFGNE